MLGSEDFSGGEDGNLIAVFERDDCGLSAYDGLAAAHVAL